MKTCGLETNKNEFFNLMRDNLLIRWREGRKEGKKGRKEGKGKGRAGVHQIKTYSIHMKNTVIR